MADDDSRRWYVEVVYPKSMIPDYVRAREKGIHACPWYWTHRGGDGLLQDSRPRGDFEWEDTYAFSTRDNADKFVGYTARQFDKWPDTAQGQTYTLRSLGDDIQEQLALVTGKIGSQRPANSGEVRQRTSDE